MVDPQRIGHGMGLNLEERKAPNPDETIAVQIWKRPNGQVSILYDPWCKNDRAQIIHGHYHTSWARNIYYNKVENIISKPAIFPEWEGKTLYLVGRGSSMQKNLMQLNSVERENPAVFISSAYCRADLQENDCVFIADSRILATGHAEYIGAIDRPLITFPGLDISITKDKWRGVYGFIPWTQSPLNNFMRELWDDSFPRTLDILCSAVMMSHLACINKVKNVVFMGMNNTCKQGSNGAMKVQDIKGRKRYTTTTYAEMSTALAQFCQIAMFHSDTKFWNATGAGILGCNIQEGSMFEQVRQITASQAIAKFEG